MTDVAGGTTGAYGADAHVTAVLVSRDGARWLPHVLAALGSLTRRPDAVVAVDTGSTDDSAQLLTAALGRDHVLTAATALPFAEALDRGVAHRPPPDDGWIWVLHDDCAPAPDALAALLAEAQHEAQHEAQDEAQDEAQGEGQGEGQGGGAGDVAVVGPKTREWPSLRRLLGVGLTIGGTGRRETGLEPGEPDQGQHDVPRDVLAVGTAGMLVRADVWRRLGGLDPALGMADDLDLGWRVARAGHRVRIAPAAVVFHAEALGRAQRVPGAGPVRVRRERRRSALLVLLVHCRVAALPVQWVRLLGGSLLRALGLLVVKAPREAWDEVRAVVAVHGRPRTLWRLRRARSRTAQVPAGQVRRRGLLPPVWQPYRAGAGAVVDLVTGLAGSTRTAPRAYAEPGPVAEEAESLAPEPGPWQRVTARPWAAVLTVLTLLALLACRDLLSGGALQGGALLPAPDGVRTWWASHLASWHPVGAGSTEPAPPYLLPLAALGLPLLGDGGLLVSLLLVLSVPLAGAAAHRFLRRLPVATGPRLWAAAAYATLPLLTGALAQGRLGTVLGAVWLPVVATTALGLGRAGAERRLVRWVLRARAGLALAVLVALVPLAYPLAVVVAAVALVAALVRRQRPGGAAVSVLTVLAVPWALAPWALLDRVRDPAAWWWEAGLADAGTGPLGPGAADLALAQPGGPGGAVLAGWLGAGVVAAGALALLRGDTRGTVVPAWCVAALGLAAAAWGAGRYESIGTGPTEVWTGFGLVLWWGGLLVAAAAAASDLRHRLADRSFGLAQPLAAATAVAALVGPLAAAAWAAVDGVDGPLERAPAVSAPSYLASDARAGARPSTVQLDGDPAHGLEVTVVREDGWRLGEEWAVDAVESAGVSRSVRDLLVSPEPADVTALASAGVGSLYAPAPVDPDLAAALDTAPGLVRSGAPLGDRAWSLDLAVGQVRVTGTDADGGTAVALDVDGADGGPPWTGTVPAGPAGRLTVAAAPDDRWQATLDGADLGGQTSGAVQTFDLAPREVDAELVVEHDDDRGWWVAGQLVLLAGLLLLAAPTRRRIR